MKFDRRFDSAFRELAVPLKFRESPFRCLTIRCKKAPRGCVGQSANGLFGWFEGTDCLDFETASVEIAETARGIHARGWVPATSGNFSLRLDDGSIAITVSGRDKSQLLPTDVMRVDREGVALENKQSSAELGLHVALYRRDAQIGAVLHTHSANATLISTRTATEVEFSDLEILKAFRGLESHEASLTIPVFENSQDIAALADDVETHMQAHGQGHAYLIRGHGLYTWARDVAECMRYLEALEFLFDFHRRAQLLR